MAKVAGGVEVGHAGRVVTVGSAFVVAEIEEAVFLIEIGLVEKYEQAAEDVVVFRFLIVGDPAIAQALENEADAVHLAVGAGCAAKGPTQTIGANQVRHHLDVLFGVGAEGGEFAVADAAVGVELERGADEHEAHQPVEIKISAEAGGRVVEETGRAGLVNAIAHAFDQARSFVFFGKAEAEAGDGFGYVEGLPVVVVIAAVEELFVDALAGFFDEAFPDGITFFGRAKSEEAERGIGEAVFGGGLGEHLRGDTTRSEVDEVEAFERGLAGGAVELAEGVGYVAWFVRARLFAGSG